MTILVAHPYQRKIKRVQRGEGFRDLFRSFLGHAKRIAPKIFRSVGKSAANFAKKELAPRAISFGKNVVLPAAQDFAGNVASDVLSGKADKGTLARAATQTRGRYQKTAEQTLKKGLDEITDAGKSKAQRVGQKQLRNLGKEQNVIMNDAVAALQTPGSSSVSQLTGQLVDRVVKNRRRQQGTGYNQV